jgi:hypothetical protein
MTGRALPSAAVRLASIVLHATLVVSLAGATRAAETSCTKCHSDADFFDEDELATVSVWAGSVHAAVGVSCHDCHGGNPDLEVAEDAEAAMDAEFAPRPFQGTPDRRDIPSFCGRCHSDPEYMKRFTPDPRIDQEQEYWTSYHGKALVRGDQRVATCVDCHGVHDISRADDPRSSVYPVRVAETCGRCHSDARRMEGTRLSDGSAIPVDQVARWRDSVHGVALMKKGDLAAPTCNDCHGNHGAAPPGVGSVTFVCGRCHGREAELLRASPKHAGLQTHLELLADAGAAGCASCHEPPDPAALLPAATKLGQCTACHGNHSVHRPTTALFASLPATPCALCHGDDAGSSAIPEPERTAAAFRRTRDALLTEATQLGLEGDARYDWLVDRALSLPNHTRVLEEGGAEQIVARPEFLRLFEKFRVGRTHFALVDPARGETRAERVRRCSDCHAEKPTLASEAAGLKVAAEMVGRMQRLETSIARAERMLLSAKRGGVAVGEAEAALDAAVDSHIELQVLVHSFSVAADGPFVRTHDQAAKHAEAALAAGREALRELRIRRQGLAFSLVAIALVLVGLGWAIREDTRSAAATAHGTPFSDGGRAAGRREDPSRS